MPLLLLLLVTFFTLLAASAEAQTITITNKLQNHYANDPFPEACPGGMPVSNIPSGYHIGTTAPSIFRLR